MARLSGGAQGARGMLQGDVVDRSGARFIPAEGQPNPGTTSPTSQTYSYACLPLLACHDNESTRVVDGPNPIFNCPKNKPLTFSNYIGNIIFIYKTPPPTIRNGKDALEFIPIEKNSHLGYYYYY